MSDFWVLVGQMEYEAFGYSGLVFSGDHGSGHEGLN